MKIAYWSMFHGQTKTTTNMLLIHIYTALTSDSTQVIISNQFSYNLIEEYLGIEKDKNSSLDNILIALRNRTIKHDSFLDYTESIIKNQALDIITESIHSKETIPKNIDELFVGIVEIANKVFKNVIIDVSAGINEFNQCILNSADIIVVNLNQNKYLIEETLSEVKKNNITNKVKYVIGDYNDSTRMTKRNIERLYKIKIEGVIPHNKNVINSLNYGEIVAFVNQNIDSQQHDENSELFLQIKSISKQYK